MLSAVAVVMKCGSVCLQPGNLLLIALCGCLVACGGGSTPSSTPVGSLPMATTTLQAETDNNTSTADSFVSQTSGNVSAGNVSKMPLRSLLYSGSKHSNLYHMARLVRQARRIT